MAGVHYDSHGEYDASRPQDLKLVVKVWPLPHNIFLGLAAAIEKAALEYIKEAGGGTLGIVDVTPRRG